MKKNWKQWVKAAVVRAVKTVAQTAVATKAVPENANEVAGLMIMAISAGAVSGPVCGAIVRAWGNPHLGMLFVAACVAYMLWASIQLKMKN